MQQALPVAFGADIKIKQAKRSSRANKFVVAGAAMACAGAVAVGPVAPTMSALPELKQQSVQLAAWVNPVLEDPLALWSKTFTDSFTQAGAVGAAVAADPFPILNQLVENQMGYLKVLIGAKAAEGQRRGTGLVGAAESVGKSIVDLPVRLQAAATFLAAGQVTEALVEVNTWALRLLEAVAFPLVPVFAIPGAMIDAVGRVYDSLVTRGALADISKGLLSPPLSVAFALANVVDQVVRSAKAGNFDEVFTAVINAPAIAVGAFFNGYQPMFGYDEAGEPILSPEFFPGVFSDGGFVDALFVQLPKTIAAALAPPVVPPATPPVTTPPALKATFVTLDVTPGADAAEVDGSVADAPATPELTETVTEEAGTPAEGAIGAVLDEEGLDGQGDDTLPTGEASGDVVVDEEPAAEAEPTEDEDDTETPAVDSTTTTEGAPSNNDGDDTE